MLLLLLHSWRLMRQHNSDAPHLHHTCMWREEAAQTPA
jgi:hypothetical protein